MALTDTAIRNSKPRERDYKLADTGGLYLLVTPAGGRLWRLKYRVDGIERKLALGRYPAVTLGEARKARDSARAQASSGTDPASEKRRDRIARRIAAGTTFGAVALEYVERAPPRGAFACNDHQIALGARMASAGDRASADRQDRAARIARRAAGDGKPG